MLSSWVSIFNVPECSFTHEHSNVNSKQLVGGAIKFVIENWVASSESLRTTGLLQLTNGLLRRIVRLRNRLANKKISSYHRKSTFASLKRPFICFVMRKTRRFNQRHPSIIPTDLRQLLMESERPFAMDECPAVTRDDEA
ncbi:hypothetical protein TNCV_3358411 [Trichonephila clavipes]|nr:hypothetical protein TNCV_3358411 [Trichonephila clavipes]